MKTTCQFCGKEFITYPCRIKKGYSKFCSKNCYSESSDLKKNLSKAQSARWKNHKKKEVNRICAFCGKIFTVHSSDLKHRPVKYCSIACRGKVFSKHIRGPNHHLWQGGKIKRECVVCGYDFYVKKEQMKRTGAKFCSLHCRSVYFVRYQSNKQNTDIELIMKNALNESEIIHEHQKTIPTIATVDFFIEPDIIIQCDGDYWHTLPKQKEKDKNINKKLSQNGYKVFRFWGSEIKENIEVCIDEIKNKGFLLERTLHD